LGCLGTATMREIEDGQLVTERNIWIADHGHLGFGRVGGGNGGSGLKHKASPAAGPRAAKALPATLRPIIIDTAIGRISQSTMAWETLRASARSISAKAERTGAYSCGVGVVHDERAQAFNREIVR